ncbi:NADPH:quinone reductase-like Zn-dependent oxidoreductase [Brevibacterium sanguinis]|uniref:NADPH:quinone reductase-like Zn-dependent oxidoreductase n=2 Tax=Brevibacterium TaxID=1696 RepID=A0A366IFZ0_9MICO|nr:MULTISPECIES: NADP-dependent oxidoreductase [Brevibacterium]RBP63597.1 NADPH:quinone reductase-like Zn-dependent oxidoreductase [Brevibacterium sanguinis]RBP70256.1 NADPH:quinone reductase-like Zn-dependent oxidoreductase [Brevibacterium celere]
MSDAKKATNPSIDTAEAEPTMRAISQDHLGGPEVLHEIELPIPKPVPGQILVRVRAAGVNPTDWKHRGGAGFLPAPPFVLGWDVCGVVEKVGVGVTLFKPGDEVYGMLPYPFGVGSHAEFVVGPTRAFVPKPTTIDEVQAGALPLVSLTAWQALVDTAEVGEGDRVLIHAAAGGVGHVAVQIAKARGAYVIGTASAPKHDFVRDLGADEVVDYRETDVAEGVKDVDVVLDTLGGQNQLESLKSLRDGGVLVSTLPFPKRGLFDAATERGIRVELILVEADHASMLAISDLVESGQLRATIAQTFPLAEAAEAHRVGEEGHTTGKLVLTMGE